MEQRSKEWFDARGGLFTASEIFNILKPKGFGITGETYIYKKAAEKLGAFDEQLYSKAMDYGIEWEYTARIWYEAAFKVDVSEIGFVKMPKLETGCSPDGWVHDKLMGIEIKCPYTVDKHLKVGLIKSENDLKSYSDQYYWQCKLSMLVMDCDTWDFISFDPRYKNYEMFVKTLHRNEQEDQFMIDRINQAAELRDEIINKIVK